MAKRTQLTRLSAGKAMHPARVHDIDQAAQEHVARRRESGLDVDGQNLTDAQIIEEMGGNGSDDYDREYVARFRHHLGGQDQPQMSQQAQGKAVHRRYYLEDNPKTDRDVALSSGDVRRGMPYRGRVTDYDTDTGQETERSPERWYSDDLDNARELHLESAATEESLDSDVEHHVFDNVRSRGKAVDRGDKTVIAIRNADIPIEQQIDEAANESNRQGQTIEQWDESMEDARRLRRHQEEGTGPYSAQAVEARRQRQQRDRDTMEESMSQPQTGEERRGERKWRGLEQGKTADKRTVDTLMHIHGSDAETNVEAVDEHYDLNQSGQAWRDSERAYNRLLDQSHQLIKTRTQGGE